MAEREDDMVTIPRKRLEQLQQSELLLYRKIHEVVECEDGFGWRYAYREAFPSEIVDAALFLANGERVEPDWEAATQKVYALYHWGNHPPELNETYLVLAREEAKAIVDAAVGGRLLVDPPKEEE